MGGIFYEDLAFVIEDAGEIWLFVDEIDAASGTCEV
jgi:hypothetical protein